MAFALQQRAVIRLLGGVGLALALGAAPIGAQAGPGFCPPGLAKKGCVPPGQAKKGYVIGAPLTLPYQILYDLQRYRLPPPPPGAIYVRVDRDVLLVAEATTSVIRAVGAISELLR